MRQFYRRGTAEEQYQFAADLLVVKNRVVAAEAALKEFIEKHPKHRRASNAWYWLGEAHFQRKRYREAAVAYGNGYSQHAQGAKAPDSLLKLGMSLGHLNMFDKACAAYARLLTKFPKAHPRLKQRVLLEQKRTKC